MKVIRVIKEVISRTFVTALSLGILLWGGGFHTLREMTYDLNLLGQEAWYQKVAIVGAPDNQDSLINKVKVAHVIKGSLKLSRSLEPWQVVVSFAEHGPYAHIDMTLLPRQWHELLDLNGDPVTTEAGWLCSQPTVSRFCPQQVIYDRAQPEVIDFTRRVILPVGLSAETFVSLIEQTTGQSVDELTAGSMSGPLQTIIWTVTLKS